MRVMDGGRLSRRELLVVGAAAGVGIGLQRSALARARAGWSGGLDFSSLPSGEGWPGWLCLGVANLGRRGGRGVLEAGSDVFPCDPRPVAYAVDQRFRDGEVTAALEATGAGAGVVLRRVGPRTYYAAVYDDEQSALVLLRRATDGAHELARLPVARATSPLRLTLSAKGVRPTQLAATIDQGVPLTVTAQDGTPELQEAGDPGVLATARTLFPSAGPGPVPALGNIHLLPYGVQEGQAFLNTDVGQEVLAKIRERSTAVFSSIAVHASGRPQVTRPSVMAASTGAPVAGGAKLRVAVDVPARVEIEVASNSHFLGSKRLRAEHTGSFDSALATVGGLPAGRRVYWRARLRRSGRESVGPVRSFRVLPRAGSSAQTTIAIAACAAQFGPIFDHIAERRPDAFVWQGDLNYPDTVGPLAQTVSGYTGIWRDFLANPRTSRIFDHSLFAAQRDDHDYGVQDANSTILVPWGLAPWESLMERRLYYRFPAGLADVWVLDQRRHKMDPKAADTPAKTLLGMKQRAWLLRTLAASRAPFKVICSPCTVAPVSGNRRDGSWAAGFNAERDLILRHIRKHVRGRTLFVTGDTHWTMVYDRDGLFEARPCPLGIPTPNDITVTDPNVAENARKTPGVKYADDEKGHVAFLTVAGRGGQAQLDLTLVREDGATPFHRRFQQALP
jgi:phosphodiesterase/alkaline phosphatase D-like protein